MALVLTDTVPVGPSSNVEKTVLEWPEVNPGLLGRRYLCFVSGRINTKGSPVGSLTFRARLAGLASPVVEIAFTPPVNLSLANYWMQFELSFIGVNPNNPSNVYIQVRGIGFVINNGSSLVFPVTSGSLPPRFDLSAQSEGVLSFSWQFATSHAANGLEVSTFEIGQLI
jgi:hypothetical protein